MIQFPKEFKVICNKCKGKQLCSTDNFKRYIFRCRYCGYSKKLFNLNDRTFQLKVKV